MLGRRFAIVTTDARWQPLLTDALHAHHLAPHSVGVFSSGLGVLDLERKPAAEVVATLGDIARRAVAHDGAEVIVLGCAGMTGLAEGVRAAVGPRVPVVDGVTAAVEMVASLARQRLFTSGAGLYASWCGLSYTLPLGPLTDPRGPRPSDRSSIVDHRLDLVPLQELAIHPSLARLVDDAEKLDRRAVGDQRVVPDPGSVRDALIGSGDEGAERGEVGATVCTASEYGMISRPPRAHAPAPESATRTRYLATVAVPPMGTNACDENSCRSSARTGNSTPAPKP
jgi:hypothetical protein